MSQIRDIFKPIAKSLVRGLGEAPMPAKPFYSPLDKAISEITQTKGTGQQIEQILKKTKGVSKELKDRPVIQELLKQPKVTKEQLTKAAAEHPAAQVFEKVEKGPSETRYRVEHDELNDRFDVVDDYSNVVKSFRDYDDAQFYAGKIEGGTTKYEDYQLLGGKNYREIKLMLPKREDAGEFKTSHFDEPNILAHARVSDRVGPNGEKILHVEEIQSDWHQKGREKGYFSKDNPRVATSAVDKGGYYEVKDQNNNFVANVPHPYMGENITPENAVTIANNRIQFPEVGRQAPDPRVPDAPFKENWHELVMKRLLDDATKKGYDRVVITPAEEQLKRYPGTEKHFGKISYLHNPDGTISVIGKDKSTGSVNLHEEDLPKDELVKKVGRELADRIMANEGLAYEGSSKKLLGSMTIPDLDVKHGGKFHRTLYDTKIPSFLNEYGKKWGASVGQHELSVPRKQPISSIQDAIDQGLVSKDEVLAMDQAQRNALMDSFRNENIPVHSFDITPQMREEITGKGQPLYQMIPAGVGAGTLAAPQEEVPEQPMKRGGAVSMDAMRLAVMNKKVQHKQYGGVAKEILKRSRIFGGKEPGRLSTNIIKEGGGNWLAGNVERQVKHLKKETAGGMDPAEALRQMKEVYSPEKTNPDLLRIIEPAVKSLEKDAAINNWVDKQLTRYIKNQMGTKEDPIRALAEKGAIHMPTYEILQYPGLMQKRLSFGMPVKNLSQSETAKNWENIVDRAIDPSTAGSWVHGSLDPSILENNTWLTKINPESMVYSAKGLRNDFGFEHIIDELRNATNPASGLPRELLIKPESLSKLSVPQAVERVAKINEWRAARKAEVDALRAMNPATFTHKEYPEGYRWVELKNPEGSVDTNALADALKYEGEQMGHCVGGYCPDVSEGRSRIYSLRDKKGQPHVTIEVEPGSLDPEKWFFEQPEEVTKAIHEVAGNSPTRLTMAHHVASHPLYQEALKNAPPSIVQIKGKSNLAPKKEYLPFVQDFVRSGQWSDVGDLKNTGMIRRGNVFTPTEKQGLIDLGQDVPEYLSQEDIVRLRRARGDIPPEEGMKRGGAVNPCDCSIDAMRFAVMNKQLRK